MFTEYQYKNIIVRINNAGIGIELNVYTKNMKYISPNNWKNKSILKAIAYALNSYADAIEEDTEKHIVYQFVV